MGDGFDDIGNEADKFRDVIGPGEVFVPFFSPANAAAVPGDCQLQSGGRILQLVGSFIAKAGPLLLTGSNPGSSCRQYSAEFLVDWAIIPAFVPFPNPFHTLLDEDCDNAVLRTVTYETLCSHKKGSEETPTELRPVY